MNPGKTSRTTQLSPELLHDPKNFELINGHSFKLASLGSICYTAKANYYKKKKKRVPGVECCCNKNLKHVALIVELEARKLIIIIKLIIKVGKNNTVSRSIDLELGITLYNLKAQRHMVVLKTSFLAKEESYGQKMEREV